jgi:hypothetical protein
MSLVYGAISTGVSIINSAGLGSVDPAKEAERITIIDTLKNDAIRAGTKTSRPYVQLACWAGAGQGTANYNLALQYGFVLPGQECRVGSDSALAYAKAAKLTVDAALAVSSIAGPIATDLAIHQVKQDVVNAMPVLLAIAAVIVVVVLIRKAR